MPEQVCPRTGKTIYASKSAASKARVVVRKRGDRNGEMQVFKCGSCGGWHLGRLMRGRKGGQAA